VSTRYRRASPSDLASVTPDKKPLDSGYGGSLGPAVMISEVHPRAGRYYGFGATHSFLIERGGNVTISLAATDLQCFFVANDGTDRFDSGPGTANVGMVQLTYTTPSALKVYAVTIP
jgi:hypothetical protein